jgi:hypothetical protein
LGFRITNSGSAGYAVLDDILLTADQDDYLFYNLTVESGTATFQDDLAASNDLTIASGAMLDMDSNKISSVGGTFTNNGTMANNETRSVATGSQTFLDARSNNAAQITYNSGNQPGNTTLTTRIGTTFPTNAFGESCPRAELGLERYYHITADTSSGISVTLRFYYNDSELNGNDEAFLEIWHCESGAWVKEAGTHSRDTTNNWVQVTGVDSFSGFAIASGSPTVVTLSSFEVTPAEGSILVTWETAIEVDNVGFNLYRSEGSGGPYIKLNDSLIPSQSPGSPSGAEYAWLDEAVEPGVTYFYKLEDVEVGGKNTFHGPISASAQTPTAVSVVRIGAQKVALAIGVPVGLLLASAVGLILVKRGRRKV